MRAHSSWLLPALLAAACGNSAAPPATADPADPKAGPASIVVPTLTISTAAADVEQGRAIYSRKGCAACHKIGGGTLVGPDLHGVTARRHQLWIERMILHPEIMVQRDATARERMRAHVAPMVSQQINPDSELPALLAYLKANER